MIYLDTSALVKLVRTETESTALHAMLTADGVPQPFTSQLAITEMKRALHAAGAEDLAGNLISTEPPALDLPGDHRVLALPVRLDIIMTAGDLQPGTALRSSDALHVATALAAGADLTMLVTYDKRMGQAAAELGLPISTPGAPARS